MPRGRLITIEGLDGAGKTTLASALAGELLQHGVTARQLREPGGVALSERIRDLVKDPEQHVGGRAEALLYAAARAQLVEEAIEPLLSAGKWVILDRFVDSSLAYQGGGRGLGLHEVARINEFGTAGLRPDRTLLLKIVPALGRKRQEGRGEGSDRLEREDETFFSMVSKAYDRIARDEPDRVRVLDAGGAPEAVLAQALTAISDLLPSVPG